MAGFTVKGLPELEKQFANLSTIPAEVIWKMLDAEADVVVAAQRATAASMLAGRFNKGAVQRAIKKGKIKLVKGVYTQYINYTGRQHGNRIAEIAFVNEYGKKGQAGRPFIRTANEQCADQAVDAGAKVLYDWIDSVN